MRGEKLRMGFFSVKMSVVKTIVVKNDCRKMSIAKNVYRTGRYCVRIG